MWWVWVKWPFCQPLISNLLHNNSQKDFSFFTRLILGTSRSWPNQLQLQSNHHQHCRQIGFEMLAECVSLKRRWCRDTENYAEMAKVGKRLIQGRILVPSSRFHYWATSDKESEKRWRMRRRGGEPLEPVMRVWHYVDNPVCGLLSHRHSAYLCKPLLSVVDWLSFVLRCNCAAVWLTSGDEVLLHPLTTHKAAPGSPHVCLSWRTKCSVRRRIHEIHFTNGCSWEGRTL